MPGSANAEPSPVEAALAAERGGALGITAHLRADRRHVQDRDIFALREAIATKLNFEMGCDPEIVEIALRVRPEDACLVPEGRDEVTTEGGLDCVVHGAEVGETVRRLQGMGTRVSLFIDPDQAQIEAAVRLGAEAVELHTGAFANAEGAMLDAEVARLRAATELALAAGLIVNAGHGMNYSNVARIREIAGLTELQHRALDRGAGDGRRDGSGGRRDAGGDAGVRLPAEPAEAAKG